MFAVMKELKAEIARLARREIKKSLGEVKRAQSAQRGRIAALRRMVGALTREAGALRKTVGKTLPSTGLQTVPQEKGQRFWITGKGVRSLRKRLGLTQAGLAKLADVSTQTVVMWERVPKKISLRRKATVAKLQAIRKLNKRAARELLQPRGRTKKS